MTVRKPIDLKIDPPCPDEPRPMKVNVFDFGRSANSALSPFFPYDEDGTIVPCVTVLRGGELGNHAFEHFNTQDEIYMVFGVNGAPMRVGDVMVGDNRHIVAAFMEDDSENFSILVIIQRQAEVGEEQHESWSKRCENCQAILHEWKFESRVDHHGDKGIPQAYAHPFTTLIECDRGARQLNEQIDEALTCGKCGHLNSPFKIDTWHWNRYAMQNWVVDECLKQYLAETAP